MNQRDLSEKLDELATRLVDANEDRLAILRIAEELRKLSNENYAPGNGTTWDAITPKNTKKIFKDKLGRTQPF